MSTTTTDKSSLKYNAYCKTEVTESDKFTFVWEIPKFSSRTEINGNCFYSKEFTINGPGNKSTKWRGRIYPNGCKSAEDYVSVYLENANDEDVMVKCSIVTVDSNMKKNKDSKKYMHMEKIRAKRGRGWDQFFDRTKDMAKFAQNDTLILVFEIIVVGDVEESIELKDSCNESEALSEKFHQDQMSRDLFLLFQRKDFADVIVMCGNKKFECHKVILSSRSPVFKAILTSNMKEQNMGTVEIKNMNPQVLEDLLSYIYTSYAPNIDTLANELFAAADQYQLEKLKELCEVKLCSNIQVENCIELLILGDMYQASTLKTKALEFVSQNMDKINISECKKTLISNPSLLFEVMELMLPKKNDNSALRKEK